MEFVIWIIIIAIICGIGYFFFSVISKSAKTAKRQGENKERLGATMNGAMKHIAGLPIAGGVSTEVYYCPDKIVFKASGQEITLSKDKIMSIEVLPGKDIGATLTGAVAGKYIAGGTMGAAIGAIVATKIYCTITYEKEGENEFIVFDTDLSGTFANKIAKDFSEKSGRATKNIEL